MPDEAVYSCRVHGLTAAIDLLCWITYLARYVIGQLASDQHGFCDMKKDLSFKFLPFVKVTYVYGAPLDSVWARLSRAPVFGL